MATAENNSIIMESTDNVTPPLNSNQTPAACLVSADRSSDQAQISIVLCDGINYSRFEEFATSDHAKVTKNLLKCLSVDVANRKIYSTKCSKPD